MLKEFHEQAAASKAAEDAGKAEAVESVRGELRADYELALQQLPIVKKGLREYLVYTEEVEAIANERGEYPDQLRGFVTEMKRSFSAPDCVEEGIRRYKTLSFQDIVYKDGRQVDVNRRPEFITTTRFLLRNHESRLSSCKSLSERIKWFLGEWLSAERSEPALMTVADPQGRGDPAVPVIDQFDV